MTSLVPTCCAGHCILRIELDALLDESWLREGLERLSTIEAINGTVSTLRTAGVSVYGQVAALESCWYMRNQLLRDTDWSSMAHGLEVRVPFVDAILLDRLGPAIASPSPPDKQDLAHCAQRLPPAMLERPKTGFTTPVRQMDCRAGRNLGARPAGMGGTGSSLVSDHRSIIAAADSPPQHEMTNGLGVLMLLTDGFGGRRRNRQVQSRFLAGA